MNSVNGLLLKLDEKGIKGTLTVEDVEVPIVVKSIHTEVRADVHRIETMGMHGVQYTRGHEEHEITIRLLCAGKASQLEDNIRQFNATRQVRLEE